MHNKIIDQVFRKALDQSWNVLRYNSRGVGNSQGAFDEGRAEYEDLQMLVSYMLRGQTDQNSYLSLLGYSFGSWLSARVFSTLEHAKALFLIAPPVGMFEFPDLSKFADRVHVIAAEKDELVSLHSLECFCKSQSISSLHVIEDADHLFVGSSVRMLKTLMPLLEKHL